VRLEIYPRVSSVNGRELSRALYSHRRATLCFCKKFAETVNADLTRRARREQLGLPSTFTLDACRHGGMTELEEAELTDGQGRALSAHRSKAYEGYAKRTEKRALAATRKRHAHKVASIALAEEKDRDIDAA